ncbi:MAG TPA: cation:proton antiporter [Solirubrobacteraceae bacterium]|nr:cation:proton antiporter [Solirubrobacteraceae bacterium]
MTGPAAGTGFDFFETFDFGVLFVGIAVFAAVGALSHQRERAFSASLIYLGLGGTAAIAIAALDIGWIDPIDDAATVEHLAEAALVMALFSAGLKLERPLTLRDWATVTRLLALAMPVTIGAVALLGAGLLGLSAGAALLLGAALAPTDPVLAGDIGVGPPGEEEEHEPNFALTAEAGLNDGLAAPFVLAGLFVAEQGGGEWAWEWLAADVVYAIAAGVGIGAGIGTLAAWSVKRLRSRDMLAATFDGFHAIATALVIYGLAELIGGYGFLGVFAGGLAFRRYEHDHEINATVHEGAERLEKLLELAVILLLGSMLTAAGLGAPGWEGWLLAALLLVVVRPLACLLCLAGSRMDHRDEKAFVAWFGVRGVGTIFYAAMIVVSGALGPDEQELVVWTCIAAVLVSIAVHGVTAGPSLSRLLARRDELRRRPSPAQPTPSARR